MGSERVAVLDASAFYAGVPFASAYDEVYMTTPQVYDEILHIKDNHDALGALFTTGRLKMTEPSLTSLDAARRAAGKTGDLPQLSKQDISVIALCIQTGIGAITDDYAISNVLRSIGLDVTPVMTRGIRQVRRWQYYCPGCGNVRDGADGRSKRCLLCGSMLKRKMTQSRRA